MVSMSKYAAKGFINLDTIRTEGKIRATIVDVEEGNYGKLVLDLGVAGKFSLNKTNTRSLIKAIGSDESRDLIGLEVELSEGRIKYQGNDVDAVVVKPLLNGQSGADDDMDVKVPY